MIKVIKDGVIMAARDNHQLAAFLNNGWEKVETAILQNNDISKKEEQLSVIEKELLPFSELEENLAEKKYSRSDIQRMKTEDLQTLAAEVGIEDAFETSGSKLKEMLIEKFAL